MRPSPEYTIEYFVTSAGRDHYREFREALDAEARGLVLSHIDRLTLGIGDVKQLDSHLWELRIHDGPGYRIYFSKIGKTIVIILAGSIKRDQERTIKLANTLLKELEKEEYAKKTS